MLERKPADPANRSGGQFFPFFCPNFADSAGLRRFRASAERPADRPLRRPRGRFVRGVETSENAVEHLPAHREQKASLADSAERWRIELWFPNSSSKPTS